MLTLRLARQASSSAMRHIGVEQMTRSGHETALIKPCLVVLNCIPDPRHASMSALRAMAVREATSGVRGGGRVGVWGRLLPAGTPRMGRFHCTAHGDERDQKCGRATQHAGAEVMWLLPTMQHVTSADNG